MGERFCMIFLLSLAAVGPYGVHAVTEQIDCDTQARQLSGEAFTVICPADCATTGRRVWGTAIYTDDSGICRAAIHDGRIPAEGGVVRVNKLPGQDSYQGSTQNGIISRSWYEAWDGSFAFSHVELINKGDERTIACPRLLVQRLNITSARYGTRTCESPGALQKLQARCGGQPSCSVRAGDDVFGDSCPGRSRLEFSYEYLNLPEYHGCFGDNGDSRALNGPQWSPPWSDPLTIQACLKHCRTGGYKFAGVESKDECYCGNNDDFDKHGRASIDDCSNRCDGEHDQFCGGHWLIEIYESSMGQYGADLALDGAQHYVYSPDFPGLSPSSKTCQWTIRARDDRHIVKLQFDLFNLAYGDVVRVRDGTEDSQHLTPADGLTAGTTVPSVPASSGSAIWVQFQSGHGIYGGRFIFWSQEISHCGPIHLHPNSGAVAAPYTGNVGVGETALVMCNNGRLVWVRCEEDQQFNDTAPYCQDETTAISSTALSTRMSHHSLATQEGFTTSLYPPSNAGQQGEGTLTRSTATFIAVGVAVPLVVIVTVVVVIVLCRRKRNTTSKSPGSGQASHLDSRASAPPSGSVGLSSLGARYVANTNGGAEDLDQSEHLYAVPDDDRARKAAKPRRGDQNKNRSPAPPVNQNQDEGFTDNVLYETADDVTAEGEGSVENILYGKVD